VVRRLVGGMAVSTLLDATVAETFRFPAKDASVPNPESRVRPQSRDRHLTPSGKRPDFARQPRAATSFALGFSVSSFQGRWSPKPRKDFGEYRRGQWNGKP
jgi:hypothetical protein